MNYELVKSSNKDIDRLVEYKKKTVFEEAAEKVVKIKSII